LRTGWKALLFVLIVIALFLTTRPLLSRVVPRPPVGSISLRVELVREFWLVLLVLAATSIMAGIERRTVRSYGYATADGLLRLATGASWGFVSISVLVGVLWLHGSLVFDGLSLGGLSACRYAAATSAGFLLLGFVEESLFRGYLQFALARALGFWWAALILSVAFGLLWHGSNAGETLLGLLSAAAGGLLFCLSLWYTKSLFWAVGFHAGWDWGQSYFYGTANSGIVIPGHLLSTHPTGNSLWSGGPTGPEGSLLLLPLLMLLLIGMCAWWGRGKPALGLREQWSW
jgi:membrane protease YdiL (CAAX protease family)